MPDMKLRRDIDAPARATSRAAIGSQQEQREGFLKCQYLPPVKKAIIASIDLFAINAI
jgi:hypothetical protein